MSTETAPQPPVRRNWFARHKILTVLGALIVLIILVSAVSGGDGDDASPANTTTAGSSETAPADEAAPAEEPPAEPAEPGIGTAVKAGDFEFTVIGVEEVGTTVGTEYVNQTAQGRYVAVNLRVANTGSSAATFFSDNVQMVDGADRTFDSDSTATLYAAPDADAWLSEINPGNAFEGRIVFDLPADAAPTVLIVKDTAFSGGERIRLQ